MKATSLLAVIAVFASLTTFAAVPASHTAARRALLIANLKRHSGAETRGVHPAKPRTQGLSTTPNLTWHWANPLPSGDQFEAVAFGNGVYVAVGQDSVIYNSTDGVNWTAAQSGLADGSELVDVIYAGGQFVAGGVAYDSFGNGTDVALTSSDGATWTTSTIIDQAGYLLSEYATHLGYGNGTYVAVNDVAATSTDGVTWTEHSIASLDPTNTTVPIFSSPVFGNGTFALLGRLGNTSSMYYSTDKGATWTAANITLGTGDLVLQIAYNGSAFVGVGVDFSGSCSSNCGLVYTSTDGQTWTRQADVVDDGQGDGFFFGLVVNGTTFVDNDNANVLTSTDGINWTVGAALNHSADRGGDSYTHMLIWSGTQYVAAGAVPLTTQTSTDYDNWTSSTGPTGSVGNISDVVFGNNQYAAVAQVTPPGAGTAYGVVLTSPDGTSWTQAYTAPVGSGGGLFGIAWSGTTYAAVGFNEGVVTSTDGVNWSVASGTSALSFLAVTYGNGKFVAVSGQGAIYTSPDAQTWTAQTSGTTDQFSSVVWSGSHFVASTQCNSSQTDLNPLYVSSDGVNWAPASISVPANDMYTFCRLRSTGTQVLALGAVGGYTAISGGFLSNGPSNPVIASSPDGVSWNVTTYTSSSGLQMGTWLTDIASVGGTSYALVANGSLYKTSDLNNWTPVAEPGLSQPGVLTAQGSRLFMYGLEGNIVYSDVPAVPTATGGSATATEATAATGTLAATGTGPLGFVIATQPANGTVSITDASTGAFTYTSNAGYIGGDSFTFTVSNSGGSSATATESVTVNPPPPTASTGSITTTTGVAASGSLTASGQGTLTFAVATQPAHGTVSIIDASTGAFTYTSTAGYTGSDSFTFTTTNAGGTSAAATESVTVKAAAKSGGGALDLLGLFLLAGCGVLRRKRRPD